MKVAKFTTHNAVRGVGRSTDKKRVIVFVIAIFAVIFALWLITKSKTTGKDNRIAPVPPVSPNNASNNPPGFTNISYVA